MTPATAKAGDNRKQPMFLGISERGELYLCMLIHGARALPKSSQTETERALGGWLAPCPQIACLT